MNFFEVRGGELWCEDVPLRQIADEVGTPVYVYSTATLERHYTVFREAFAPRKVLVAYAVKANSNVSVLKTLARLGAEGADTASRRARSAAPLPPGIQPSRIVFSGVGKSRRELAFAVEVGVSEINVESEPELDTLIEVAELLDAKPKITLPRQSGRCGRRPCEDLIDRQEREQVRGVVPPEAERLYAKAAACLHVEPIGVACHIGSQDQRPSPSMAKAFAKMRGLVERLRANGLPVERLDLGGGLGAPYFDQPDPPTPAAFAAMVAEVLEGPRRRAGVRARTGDRGQRRHPVVACDPRARASGRAAFPGGGRGHERPVRPAMYDAFHGHPVRSARRGRARTF